MKQLILIMVLSMISLDAWSSDTDVNQLLKEVEQVIEHARNTNSLWRDTEKLFIEAQDLAASGKATEAQIQIQEVIFQLDTAKEQSNQQKDKDIVPYYLK